MLYYKVIFFMKDIMFKSIALLCLLTLNIVSCAQDEFKKYMCIAAVTIPSMIWIGTKVLQMQTENRRWPYHNMSTKELGTTKESLRNRAEKTGGFILGEMAVIGTGLLYGRYFKK